jgi:hypothetical protein
VDELALRTICPLAFSTAPVASTIRLGAEIVGLLVIGGKERLLLLGLRDTQSICGVSGVRMSLGLGGKPPRPVITNRFWRRNLDCSNLGLLWCQLVLLAIQLSHCWDRY